MPHYDVIVIGAGPAGLLAAGQAASLEKKVLLLEKMKTPGRKLLLTGKNRCNLTNTAPVQEALGHFNKGGRFLTQLFYRYYTDELREFFADLGLPTVVQRGGRVFPQSEKARDVLEVLLTWIKKLGVELITDSGRKNPSGCNGKSNLPGASCNPDNWWKSISRNRIYRGWVCFCPAFWT